MIAAEIDDEIMRRAKQVGVNQVFFKPVRISDLKKVISECFDDMTS